MKIFRGRLVLLDDGLGPATIVTKDGKIVAIHKSLDVPEGSKKQFLFTAKLF